MNIEKYKYTGKSRFDIKDTKTNDKGEFNSREDAVNEFVENLKKIHELQQKLYAERKESVIFVFQAMDAAGKDGCIRTVFSTLTPHGVKEFCFKAPSNEELAHDYLWRFWSALPAKGNISIFNRSYYEDVLIGKVHKLYEKQVVPDRLKGIDVIEKRYGEINDFEKYLYNNGTRVVKIFLNVSKDEQAKRFISRIDTPRKNWKVSTGDIKEREYWDEYQNAFESMINSTSCKNSPWYVVPADHKWYARLVVSRIVIKTLEEINPQYPELDETTKSEMHLYRDKLLKELGKDDEKKYTGTKFSTGQLMQMEMAAKTKMSQKENNQKKKNKKVKIKKAKKKDKKYTASELLKLGKETNEMEIATTSKNEDVVKAIEVPDNTEENVFFDPSNIVTDSYIESEKEKLDKNNGDENG